MRTLPGLLEGRVVTKGDLIPINMMGRKIGFVVTNTAPLSSSNTAILLDASTCLFIITSINLDDT
ncbi:MAG TPA: hypothetical protein VFJ51_08545 [Nitrososphaeraceae archaeon]|nr:hypothetical protein [Nitrososphaeraceae archaeon]